MKIRRLPYSTHPSRVLRFSEGFPAPAAPPPSYAPKPYAGRVKSFKKGGYSYKRVGRDRDHDRFTPSATITKPSKSGDGQTTMTVKVPQDSNKRKVQRHEGPLALNVPIEGEGAEKIGNSRNEDVLPPQPVPVGGRLCQFVDGWKCIMNDPYMLSVISKGYRLCFKSSPLPLKTHGK